MTVNVKETAERNILGSILLDNRLFFDCAGLRPSYFGLSQHQRIFAAMEELDDAGKPIDIVTVQDALTGSNGLEAAGGAAYISELAVGAIERPNLHAYVGIVRDAAKRRALANSCASLLGQLEDTTTNINALLDSQEDLILKLRAVGQSEGACHVKEVIPAVMGELDAQLRHSGELIGYTTGIQSIDEITTGIRKGEYWAVGGSPSRGKTVLGAQIIAANAPRGVHCLAFTKEMSKEQFVKRLIPRFSKVPAARIRDFRFAKQEQREMVQLAADAMKLWPFWVCDPENMTAAELVAVAKLHIRRHGVQLIVVDYLQIVEGPEHEIRHRVSGVSNALRSLAKSESVAVVALSQLRRPQDENERPTMFWFKETGDIEAHCHTALLIYRPKDDAGNWSGEDEIIIGKQREGLVGSQPVVMDADELWFKPRFVERVSQ